jgi:hypothetical protein
VLWALVLVGVVLVGALVVHVVLVVHLLGLSLGLALGLLAVEPVLALGLSLGVVLVVDLWAYMITIGLTSLSTSAPAKPARSSLANWWETGLPMTGVSRAWARMGLCVITLGALVVLEGFEASESSASCNHLMSKARLVLFEVVVLVHLLVFVFVAVCGVLDTAQGFLFRARRDKLDLPQKPIVCDFKCKFI